MVSWLRTQRTQGTQAEEKEQNPRHVVTCQSLVKERMMTGYDSDKTIPGQQLGRVTVGEAVNFTSHGSPLSKA